MNLKIVTVLIVIGGNVLTFPAKIVINCFMNEKKHVGLKAGWVANANESVWQRDQKDVFVSLLEFILNPNPVFEKKHFGPFHLYRNLHQPYGISQNDRVESCQAKISVGR